MKVWSFFVSLLLISLFFAYYINPTDYQKKTKVTVPLVEFEEYQVYSIKKTGVDRMLVALNGRHYKDREELDMPVFIDLKDGTISTINASLAVSKANIAILSDKVVYSDSDDYLLITEKAVYNRTNGHLNGTGGFVLTKQTDKVLGSEFLVKTEQKTIDAKSVRAFYTIKE